jgi:hypothetical protein
MKKCILLLAFLSSIITLSAQDICIDTVYIEIVGEKVNGKIQAHFNAYEFEDISSVQFTVKYNPEVLQFDQIIEYPGVLEQITFNDQVSGEVGLIWFDNSGNTTIDVPNGDPIFSFEFTPLTLGNGNIEIVNDPVAIEIGTNFLDQYCLESPPSEVAVDGAVITGNVYHNIAGDCTLDAEDTRLENWMIEVNSGTNTFYIDTDEDGYYNILVDEGSYVLNLITPNTLWSSCVEEIVTPELVNNDSYTADFLAYPNTFCSLLNVDISAPFLRRCFDNNYYVNYCNEGTELAEDAYVEIELDPNMEFVDAGIPHTQDGQTVSFQVGDIPVGACGSFYLKVHILCETTTLGQTHCVTATIFPENDCTVPDAQWTGANLEVNGYCDGDSVRFEIQNTGINPMENTVNFIVIEDDVMIIDEGLPLLDAQAVHLLSFPADGATYRTTVEQVPFHPSLDDPSLAIEACTIGAEFSTGFVTMFSNADEDSNIDIDCQENIGSYDPNDKAASPKGYRDQSFIKANMPIDYKLRFQNTGTDTAFRVIIKDELTENLDLSTIQLGSSSHDYEFSIEDGRTAVFTFNNIELVDSTTNEPGSHGFVKFKIDQVADHEDGTHIINSGDIFFDFNEAVVTNEVDLLIGTEFVEILSSIYPTAPDVAINLYPNPSSDYIHVEVKNYALDKNASIHIMNNLGQTIITENIDQNSRINTSGLSAGSYIFRIINDNVVIAYGTFVSE